MKKLFPYVVSQDKKSGAWYCHRREWPNIPVFGSVGDKKKANAICKIMNESLGYVRGRTKENFY